MSKSVVFIIIVTAIVAVAAIGWYYLSNIQNKEFNQGNIKNKIGTVETDQEIPVNNGGPQGAAENQINNIKDKSVPQTPEMPEPLPVPDNGQIQYNTPQGAIDASQIKEEDPRPVAQTYSYITTCNQACTVIGYNAGYCGNWIENSDNTISECANRQEFPFSQDYYDGMKLKDCQFTGDIYAKKKTICCCKGEPQNPTDCPVIQWPNVPMACVEQPGYLKNPQTGTCCWYRATCYGPNDNGWTEYRTKAECLAK
ncbi:MAG: hypothetical protein WC725_05680 [Patescibacteria group bacterium]|jgi:hypothetical protein